MKSSSKLQIIRRELSWKVVCNYNQNVKAVVQKHSQRQRIGVEPLAEMLKNITLPRDPSIG